jgi:deazaflavin-dependent oxidoreductase (nitroreductase family)
MAGKQPKPFSAREERMLALVVKPMSHLNTWLYRISGGRLGGRWMYGAPVMLLSYTGRKSGRRMTTPLLYIRDGREVITVASKGGSATHPLWYLNLRTNPDCEVEIGREVTRMRARTATADEKKKLWPALVKVYPDYEAYQARSPRDIPVVVLSPV